MSRTITVHETVSIARPPEAVWDYTQDYGHRREWDAAVEVVEWTGSDPRRYRLKLAGTGWVALEYKLDRRPERTSLQMTPEASGWLAGGGGSWQYAAVHDGTAWSQTNTLVLRDGVVTAVLAPVLRWQLRRATRRSMRRAKGILEA